MSATKKFFVTQALAKIGYANYIFDLTPEQINAVLINLDNMIAEWNAATIRIGYPLPDDPLKSHIDDKTYVPSGFNNAVIYNLAVRIAPDFGKTIPPEILSVATKSYDALLIQAVFPNPMQYPGELPLGSGNKPWRRTGNPFVIPPVDTIDADNGNTLDF